MFYQEYPDAEGVIERLLAEGIPSYEPGLEDVLSVARDRSHPLFEKLAEYKNRITG